MLSFTIWNVKITVTCECGRVVPCRKLVYFLISKLILYFPYCFHLPCTVLFTLYFHTVLSMFHFLYYLTRKQTLLIKRFNFVFIEDRPSVNQQWCIQDFGRPYTDLSHQTLASKNIFQLFFFQLYFDKTYVEVVVNNFTVHLITWK